ncbi:hypothetical protein M422DRAFT_259609 [Sphaerobolus stellatus SS14]|uniref:Unplaced genomic scaffold SPHSTscaffold_91, whole genome shotgun sequence n=1 Tax=Sphaerobolus stellatus (strain SS14) TaxID=990650 RepID=A0A0C9USH7_SPHS4|nr:hypothetical protein M422DRAFT_259609 [Sphaerobolus stellatus SS14]
MPFPRLNINPYAARHRSLRQNPVIDPNIAQLCAKPLTALEEHFKFMCDWQARSLNMLFYNCHIGEVVEYGFPAYNAVPILPHHVKAYNEKWWQKFECFCGQFSPSAPVFANTYVVQEGDIAAAYAICHTCSLSVSFNEKYVTSTMWKTYPGFHKYSEMMTVPSRPERLPRELAITVPYQVPTPRTYRTRGLITVLDLHHPGPALVPSLLTQSTMKLFKDSPPSASSILKRCLGKGKGKAPARTPSRAPSCFMTLDSPSSSVMEGVIAGPSNFSGNFSCNGENIPSSSQDSDDEDVLVYCSRCYAYQSMDHICHPRLLGDVLLSHRAILGNLPTVPAARFRQIDAIRSIYDDVSWIKHLGRTCPGDPALGITHGQDYIAPPVKREIAGTIMFYGKFKDRGEDQPDPYYEPRDDDTDSDV